MYWACHYTYICYHLCCNTFISFDKRTWKRTQNSQRHYYANCRFIVHSHVLNCYHRTKQSHGKNGCWPTKWETIRKLSIFNFFIGLICELRQLIRFLYGSKWILEKYSFDHYLDDNDNILLEDSSSFCVVVLTLQSIQSTGQKK